MNLLPAPLLSRLCDGPYHGLVRSRDFAFLLVERGYPEQTCTLFVREGLPGVRPGTPTTYAGVLEASSSDWAAMLSGRVPQEGVVVKLGNQPGNPRILQAIGLVVAAGLGWAGRWPDPDAAPEHHQLLRRACLDLRVGPEDDRCYLGKPGGPEVRLREVAQGVSMVTEGLTDDAHGPELSVIAPSIALGLARLRTLTRQLLDGQPLIPTARIPLPLARHIAELWEFSLD